MFLVEKTPTYSYDFLKYQLKASLFVTHLFQPKAFCTLENPFIRKEAFKKIEKGEDASA